MRILNFHFGFLKPEANAGTCGECQFWDPSGVSSLDQKASAEGEPLLGLCRRLPPAVGETTDAQPTISRGEWCGEWRRKK